MFSIVTTGCAFSVHQKPINYNFSGELNQNTQKSYSKKLQVGDITDIRDVTTPKMIMNMRNLNGERTTGGWEAEKPIAEIVKDAFIQGIQTSNLKMADTGDLLMTGEVVNYIGEGRMSGLSGTFEGKLTVKIQLRDMTENKIIWRDTFIGQASIKKGDYITDGFRSSLDSLVANVLTDEYFLQQLE